MRTIFRVAAGQLGLVTRADLRRGGLSDHQIVTLAKKGVIEPVHRGVFRVPGGDVTVAQRALAACIACGPDTVASFRTAGALWGLIDAGEKVDVTLPNSRHSGRAGIVVHRVSALPRCDRTTIGPVPVTTPARTIIDIAGVVPFADLERSLDEALRRGLVSPERLRQRLEDLDHAPGRRALLRLIRDRVDGGVPESELERRAAALLKRSRLPKPVRQLEVVTAGRRFRLDLAYPDKMIAIELDGRAPHWGRDRWEADHARQNALKLAGWRILRFTWSDITERGDLVISQIRQALALAS